MGMTIEEAIIRYKNNAEYERTHGNLQGCLEFRQLVEWLSKYQKIEDIVNNRYGKPVFKTLDEVIKVVEDGKTD